MQGNQIIEEITAKELKDRMGRGEDIQLIDVREPYEYDYARIPGAKLIPLGQVLSRMEEIDPSKETIVHCKAGGRSAHAIAAMRQAGYEGKLYNLKGGITAWATDVDPSVPRY